MIKTFDWQPLDIQETVNLMNGFEPLWMIAGGYALELFVGKPYREHGDMDIQVLRGSQLALQEYLQGWDLYFAKDRVLHHWPDGLWLESPIKDIWGRKKGHKYWQLQIMLFEQQNEFWIYRRDKRVRKNLASIVKQTAEAIRYLAPEVQLLYKSKPPLRSKDQLDFEVCLPLLTGEEKCWLGQMLAMVYNGEHQWIESLKDIKL